MQFSGKMSLPRVSENDPYFQTVLVSKKELERPKIRNVKFGMSTLSAFRIPRTFTEILMLEKKK